MELVVPGFEIVGRLAAGRTEAIYEAIRVGAGGFRKPVALRVQIADSPTPDGFVEELLAWARRAGQIDHPNIVAVLDALVVDGAPVLVAELVRGVHLASLIDTGPLPPWAVLSIADQVLDGLAHGHRAFSPDLPGGGLVHGDVTPPNVLIAWSGWVRLVDFGLAGRGSRRSSMPSPEQEAGAAVDGRSDLWQLGHLVQRCLTGPGDVELTRRGVTPTVRRLVERATAVHPAVRFPDAAAMQAEVRRCLQRMAHGGTADLGRWLAERAGPAALVPETAPSPSPAPVSVSSTARERPRRRAAPARGRPLPSRFEVVRTLGRGGMGLVLQAWDSVLRRDVAVKVLHDDLAADVSSRERFIREARAAATLRHPSIVTVFDVDEGGRFIVMELVPGETLAQRLRREKLPAAEVRRVGLTVAGALETAHSAGIVHRDVTPSNVLLDDRGQIRLADFGVALVADSELTRTGIRMGTPAYMSPEQLRGLPVDGRADIYSIGAVLFEAATGQRLHGPEGPCPDPRAAVLAATGDEALAAAVARAVADHPAERFQTAAELALALAPPGDSRPAPAP